MHTSSAREPVKAAFSRWLRSRLQSIYDGITREPVPGELLALAKAQRPRPYARGTHRAQSR
jgi:hypothetical protein